MQTFAAAAFGSLKGLLAHFDIQGEMRRRMRRAGLSLEAITAWYLDAEREDGVDYRERYMIKQAAAGESPPEPFLTLANLSWEQWRTYAAAWHLQSWLDDRALEELFKLSTFSPWRDIYSEVAPEQLPLGVGEGLDTLARSLEQVEAKKSDAGDDKDDELSHCEGAFHWQAALDELALQMTRATFDSWLRDARFVRRDGDTFFVAVRNEAAKDWLTNRMQGVIERTLSVVVGEEQKVRFVVESASGSGAL